MKMEALEGIVLLLLLSCCSWMFVHGAGSCKKINSCSCSLGDTHIDLSPLKGNPKWSDQLDRYGNNKYSFNPCESFSEGDCKNIAVCQIMAGTMYFECGSQGSAEFVTDPSSGQISIHYASTDADDFTRKSVVVLNCVSEGTADSLDVNGEDLSDLGTYDFQINSVHCCPKAGSGGGDDEGISAGSVMVIAFFALVIVYLLAGVIIQKFARKAQGKDIVPNVTFWTAVPGLIKDGVLFTVKCGKSTPKYDSI